MNRSIRARDVRRVVACLVTACVVVSGTIFGETVGLQSDGSIVVPTNQTLTPAGFQITFPGRPTDLALNPDETILAIKNKNDLILVHVPDRTITQTLRVGRGGHGWAGITFSRDGRSIYTTQSDDSLMVASLDDSDVARWKQVTRLRIRSREGKSVPGGLALSLDEKFAYVALSRYNALGVVDLVKPRLVETIDVGICPYTVVLASADKAYVSNWGGRRPQPGEPVGPTSGSQVLVDPATGIANNGTVSVIDLTRRRVTKTIEVGLHPSGMVFSNDRSRLFITNANSDTVSVIDTSTDEVVETILVRPMRSLLFGSAPNAAAISPDGTQLYVANGTNNAIAVIELGAASTPDGTGPEESMIKGFIPTAWYPGAVIPDRDGTRLFVANTKGLGSLNRRTDRAGYNSHDHLGSVSIIELPDADELARYTDQVKENNRAALALAGLEPPDPNAKPLPVPKRHGEPSVLKHVIYIIKENRTYDQVLGDMPQGNGDPRLCMFGREVTPNHHALAEEFVLFDNFYCSGILSADGHQWTDEAYVTDYLEKQFATWPRSYPYDGDDALAYASSGFIWDNALHHGLTFRDYGEFVKARITPPNATFTQIYQDYLNGTQDVTIRADTELETLRPYLCPTYVGFPESVPDVYRAREFILELRQFEKSGQLPNFIIMLLPNDHTSGTRPGRPTPRAAVADNDLALGQIVEAVSHSAFWPTTCIFVVEDDPQAGLDHVDGHRTVAFAISPYTRRRYVDSTNYNQVGMVKTIELILGLPPMNQLDLAATPMRTCFQETADLTPYKARPNNIPLDELNRPITELSGPARYWALKSMEENLDEIDRADEDTLNRILWHATKGYDVPYPIHLANKGW